VTSEFKAQQASEEALRARLWKASFINLFAAGCPLSLSAEGILTHNSSGKYSVVFVMLKSSAMVGILVLLAMTSLMAFTKHWRLSAIVNGSKKGPIVSRSLLMSLNSPAIESIKHQMMVNRKPPPPTVVLEERRISIVTVPSIREIEDAAKISERSIASKTFCTRSGGYPDLDVKDGIYLLLWASMTHNLHSTQLRSQILAAK
jgi:hypothetical protein